MITIKRGNEHLREPGAEPCVIVGDYQQHEFRIKGRPNAWDLRYGRAVHALTTLGDHREWFVPARTAFAPHLTNNMGTRGAYADYPPTDDAMQAAIAAAVAYVEGCEASRFQVSIDGQRQVNLDFPTLSAARHVVDRLRLHDFDKWAGVVRVFDEEVVYRRPGW